MRNTAASPNAPDQAIDHRRNSLAASAAELGTAALFLPAAAHRVRRIGNHLKLRGRIDGCGTHRPKPEPAQAGQTRACSLPAAEFLFGTFGQRLCHAQGGHGIIIFGDRQRFFRFVLVLVQRHHPSGRRRSAVAHRLARLGRWRRYGRMRAGSWQQALHLMGQRPTGCFCRDGSGLRVAKSPLWAMARISCVESGPNSRPLIIQNQSTSIGRPHQSSPCLPHPLTLKSNLWRIYFLAAKARMAIPPC